MIAALLVGLALGGPADDGLSPVLATFYATARAHEAAGRYREAANGYAVVARGDPWFGAAMLDLGRVLEREGRLDEALATYAKRPDDPEAVHARARIALDLGDLETSRALIDDLQALAPNRPGWRILEARRLARDRPAAALEHLDDYLAFYGTSIDDDGFATAWRAALAAIDGEDDVAVARRHLDTWLAEFPEAATAPTLGSARRDLAIDQAARALAASGTEPLGPDQLRRLSEARAAFVDGHHGHAAALLGDLIAEQPRSAVAWATLSDVRAAQGDLTGSIEAIDAAIELDPLDADALARRGARLFEGFGGRLDSEAVDAYRRAAERRPNDAAIWLGKARAERRSGRWREAAASYREVLRLDEEGPGSEEAERAITDVERPLPRSTDLLPGRGRPANVPEAAWTAYFRAWAWREHQPTVGSGDPIRPEEADARAWAEVQRARQVAPDFLPAANLEATMLAERGELDDAIALLRASLARDQGQPETWLTLARVLDERGDPEAQRAFDRAAELGHPAALWRRARTLANRGRWWRARDALATYFGATTHGPHYEEAVALDRLLARRIQRVLGLGGLVGILALVVPLGIGVFRRSGVGLDELTERAPLAWSSIVRVLATIRHEVLKHHTSALPTVAKALDEGDDDPAAWIADRLFGERGALARLDRYLEELVALARTHGTRLALRHGDPTLGALVDSADRLRRLEPELRAPTDRGRLADTLRDVAGKLHGEVYPALGRRIAELATLRLTRARVASVVDDVASEPAFVDATLTCEIDWPEAPVWVRLSPGDLLDLLGNLVRNALAASTTLPEGAARRTAVVGRIEADPVTGLEQLAIAVCDTHPQSLTTAMIRSRYVARGLGIAADLATRAGGSIAVEDGPEGFTKAVIVRLPVVEPSEEET